MIIRILGGRRALGGLIHVGSRTRRIQTHLTDIAIENEADLVNRAVIQCPDSDRLPMYVMGWCFLLMIITLIGLLFAIPGDPYLWAMIAISSGMCTLFFLAPMRPFAAEPPRDESLGTDSHAGRIGTGEYRVLQGGQQLQRSAFARDAIGVSPIRRALIDPATKRHVFSDDVWYGVWLRLRGPVGEVRILIGVSMEEDLAVAAANRLCLFDKSLGSPIYLPKEVRVVPCPFGIDCPYRRRRLIHPGEFLEAD